MITSKKERHLKVIVSFLAEKNDIPLDKQGTTFSHFAFGPKANGGVPVRNMFRPPSI
jgi:hypothetical protein